MIGNYTNSSIIHDIGAYVYIIIILEKLRNDYHEKNNKSTRRNN